MPGSVEGLGSEFMDTCTVTFIVIEHNILWNIVCTWFKSTLFAYRKSRLSWSLSVGKQVLLVDTLSLFISV